LGGGRGARSCRTGLPGGGGGGWMRRWWAVAARVVSACRAFFKLWIAGCVQLLSCLRLRGCALCNALYAHTLLCGCVHTCVRSLRVCVLPLRRQERFQCVYDHNHATPPPPPAPPHVTPASRRVLSPCVCPRHAGSWRAAAGHGAVGCPGINGQVGSCPRVRRVGRAHPTQCVSAAMCLHLCVAFLPVTVCRCRGRLRCRCRCCCRFRCVLRPGFGHSHGLTAPPPACLTRFFSRAIDVFRAPTFMRGCMLSFREFCRLSFNSPPPPPSPNMHRTEFCVAVVSLQRWETFSTSRTC
jgi:hypothetical protein